ncbi:MAG TPA: hypothetical protein VGS12_14585, partial [Caulobacteraceae bacterium]|nr:hypothetical protein [Caulobacteraceae bacterium]
GNIPRGKLTSLKGRSGVFIGRVKTRSGKVIDGVWQRPPGKGGRGAGALRLLIAFEDPKKVRPNLNYFERARRTIDRAIEPAFDAAMARAIATAR